MQDQQQIQIFN